ncbi:LysR family transcriptional regulator [Nostoc sp. CHAB 5834]|nr:LysR family transcriptional regulator [Nostoc sp. CHAB 5834]
MARSPESGISPSNAPPGGDAPPAHPRLRLRLLLGGSAMLGPGKAELLEHIRDTGSISAAGRRMEMSYKRAWMLVDTMNAMFRDPLVDSARGGAGGGGARLTAAGTQVLARYRAIEAAAARAGAADIAALAALLGDAGRAPPGSGVAALK